VPLVEIVSEPDLASPDEASAYLKALRDVLVALGVCNGDMEKGSFRCDAKRVGDAPGREGLGTRTELKNNQLLQVRARGARYEIRRQIDVLQGGGEVVQETRLYDAERRRTDPMRSKEEAHDYRYFPDPDLLPLEVSQAWIEELRSALPELPRDRDAALRGAVRPAARRRPGADGGRRPGGGRLLRPGGHALPGLQEAGELVQGRALPASGGRGAARRARAQAAGVRGAALAGGRGEVSSSGARRSSPRC
jgi:Glu-tRNA(Gln) amidotransferase subunit E-like FAD-binding protein